jgi:hypothetical protein
VRIRTGLALVLLVAGLGATSLWAQRTSDSAVAAAPAAVGPHRRHVAGLAADSANPPAAQPTPVFDGARWVRISIRIQAHELGVTATGFKIVPIIATADAPLPSVLDSPAAVAGQFSLSPEGADSVGCTWSAQITKPGFLMTVHHSGDLDILASIDPPEWHYDVTCPGSPQKLRSPAFGEEGLFLFLRDVMAPYRTTVNGMDGVRLPTRLDLTRPDCVKRSNSFAMQSVSGYAEVFVYVYQPDFPGGCNFPAVPPLDPLAPLNP